MIVQKEKGKKHIHIMKYTRDLLFLHLPSSYAIGRKDYFLCIFLLLYLKEPKNKENILTGDPLGGLIKGRNSEL